MSYQNPTEHKEFTLSAVALELPSGAWRGSFIIQKRGEIVYRSINLTSFDSQLEAEEQAISMACRIADGEIPEIKLERKNHVVSRHRSAG
jgi:hypothetical protein